METPPIDTDKLAWEWEEMADEWLNLRIHLAFYLIFNAALAYFDLFVEGGGTWFFWPLAGWGMGVAVHYLGLRQHERTLRRRAQRAGISLAELR